MAGLSGVNDEWKLYPVTGRVLVKQGFYLVVYDIVDNRKRYRLVETLKDYGFRVQKSVFECRLTEKQYREMRDKLEKIIDLKRDSLIIYPLSSVYLQERRVLGVKVISADRNYMIL